MLAVAAARGPRAVLAARCRVLPRGTQRLVAELAGLSAETVTRWKKGTGNPRLDELEAFAYALKVSVVYLISDEREETPIYPPTTAEERRLAGLVDRGERLGAELEEALRKLRKP